MYLYQVFGGETVFIRRGGCTLGVEGYARSSTDGALTVPEFYTAGIFSTAVQGRADCWVCCAMRTSLQTDNSFLDPSPLTAHNFTAKVNRKWRKDLYG